MTPSSPRSTEADLDRPTGLDALIRGRRSVRKLLPDPVPGEVIRGAIEAAGWAPSPHGRQPWRFAIIESAAVKRQLAEAMAATWREQLALDGQDQAVIGIRLRKSQERITGAPVIVVACLYLADLDVYPDPDRAEAERTMAIQSLGAAVQNFLLHVYASGYDAGWMCAPLFRPDVVRDTLDLPAGLIAQAMLPVGRAAADPVRRPRRPVDDLIAMWE
ncbi:MAG TPA: nitroreductase family protein [Thermomicrobiales bacterium]|nr:nitroreductase family protein [Thermomicrobiales bacterium]